MPSISFTFTAPSLATWKDRIFAGDPAAMEHGPDLALLGFVSC
jgi:hypothetical protein